MPSPTELEAIAFSPVTLRQTLLDYIAARSSTPERGEPASIWLKMNALVDPEIIDALYDASQAGVKIELIVRGICCLRPGIPGLLGQYPGEVDRRPLPRAQPHLLLRQGDAAALAQGQGVHQLGRLDAAQPRLARRGDGADPQHDRA